MDCCFQFPLNLLHNCATFQPDFLVQRCSESRLIWPNRCIKTRTCRCGTARAVPGCWPNGSSYITHGVNHPSRSVFVGLLRSVYPQGRAPPGTVGSILERGQLEMDWTIYTHILAYPIFPGSVTFFGLCTTHFMAPWPFPNGKSPNESPGDLESCWWRRSENLNRWNLAHWQKDNYKGSNPSPKKHIESHRSSLVQVEEPLFRPKRNEPQWILAKSCATFGWLKHVETCWNPWCSFTTCLNWCRIWQPSTVSHT